MEDLGKRYELLVKECQALRRENEELKSVLRKNGIVYSTIHPPVNLSLEEKVKLFRSYFKGREDVFARRWFSRITGKSGYQPVCVNEWQRGLCDKKAHKCAECPNRSFAPLDDRDIYRHLEGKDENCCDVVGLYAIMPDNHCAFLCTDFDDKSCSHGYKSDVLAFVKTCKEWSLPCSIERSRSGNGAHVWIFFETPILAYKARRLSNAILTEAMNHDGRLSFNSYDRFFPNQDTVPMGGFGSLVALPLQGRARRMGNSVFVDEDFLPYPDQWTYLYHAKKVSETFVDALLLKYKIDDFSNLTASTEAKPWATPIPQNLTEEDFLNAIEITKADKIYIPLKGVSAKVVNHLKRLASFKNPEFYSKQAMRLSTYSIPRILSCADFTDEYMAMPRGCEEEIVKLFENYSADYRIIDETNHGLAINVTFNGQEREEQLEAINALMPHTNGILSATTAFGKTVTAAALIARRKVNTLILVHTKSLLNQWHERLSSFLDIEYSESEKFSKRVHVKTFSPIGRFDSTSNSLHGIIDIALMQSCLEDGEAKPFLQDYGMVIVDECHHVSSVTFERVLKSVKAQYVYGLTATPIRKDGHQPIIFMQCGPIRFTVDAKKQMEKQSFQRYLVPRFTSFRSIDSNQKSFAQLMQELSEDELRNNMIFADVCQAVTSGRTPLILTSRTSHVKRLCGMLSQTIKNVVQLTGADSRKEKQEALRLLSTVPRNEPLVVVATGKYVGEGFDYPRLDTLFLALPIAWKGLVAQYAGRLHRENESKKDVRIYDYIDIHEPICDSMYRKRLKGYASIGYKVIEKDFPSLFDTPSDLELATTESQIFKGRTFYRPFCKGLSMAKHSIVISSPRLYQVERNSLVPLLKELSERGTEISVLTKTEDEQTKYLSLQGIDVKVAPNLTLCCSIIDKSVLWYGSVNVLGYMSDDDNIIKIEDSMLASEFIGELYL